MCTVLRRCEGVMRVGLRMEFWVVRVRADEGQDDMAGGSGGSWRRSVETIGGRDLQQMRIRVARCS